MKIEKNLGKSMEKKDGGGASASPLWREELPIRSADERYVNRRQLAKFLVLTSVGMFVGNLWILVKSWFARPRRPGEPPSPALPALAVVHLAALPVGSVKLFSYPGPDDPCILVRSAADRWAAYSQKCTHLSCAVVYGAESGQLECPCHRGFFSVHDGRVLAGPPQRPLPRIVLERRGDQLVATGIRLEEEA